MLVGSLGGGFSLGGFFNPHDLCGSSEMEFMEWNKDPKAVMQRHRPEAGDWGIILVTQHGRMVHQLLQGPVQMRERLRTAPELHLRAEVIPPLLAQPAQPTRPPDLQRHALPDLVSGDAGADRDDLADRLVAETQRRADLEGPVAARGVVVQVRAADAGALYGDLDVGGAGEGDVAGFLDWDINIGPCSSSSPSSDISWSLFLVILFVFLLSLSSQFPYYSLLLVFLLSFSLSLSSWPFFFWAFLLLAILVGLHLACLSSLIYLAFCFGKT